MATMEVQAGIAQICHMGPKTATFASHPPSPLQKRQPETGQMPPMGGDDVRKSIGARADDALVNDTIIEARLLLMDLGLVAPGHSVFDATVLSGLMKT